MLAGLLFLGAAGPGAADDVGVPVTDALTPSHVDLVLGIGASTTIPKTLTLEAAPPSADIMLAVDTTGSMGAAIAQAKTDAVSIVHTIGAAIPGARFAVVDFKDYPTDGPGLGVPGDHPYLLRQGLTNDADLVDAAVGDMTATGGGDAAESHNRVVYESYSDPALGRNPDAPLFIVFLTDQVPHDANQSVDFSDCPDTPPTDPGRDGLTGTTDDLTTVQTFREAKSHHTNVSAVIYNPTAAVNACWTQLTAFMGGQRVTRAETSSLASQIVEVVQEDAARIDEVVFEVSEGFESWVSFTPPAPYGPFEAPISKMFEETITVPDGTEPGVYTFNVHAVVDGAVRADQSITVDVRPQTVSTLTITADQRTNVPGLSAVPFGSIPASRIPAFAGNVASTPGGSIPGGSIPGGSIPGGSIPGGSIPGGSISFGDIGFGASTPGGSIPGGSIPGGSIGLQRALQTVLLSHVPLLDHASGATWDQVLAPPSTLSGRPLNTLTLYDVANDSTAWTRLTALPLRHVPFATSLWGGVPVAAWLLGNATLAQLPPPSGYSTWAQALDASGGSSAGLDPSTNTVFGVAVAGQLGHTDIGALPGGSIPGGSIPAREILLNSINLARTRLAAVQLADISPLADIVSCSSSFDCTGKTLGQAQQASAIRGSATFGMLLDRLPLNHPARQMTLSELIFGFLPSTFYPWELLDVQGLQDVAGTGRNVDYHVDFDFDCDLAGSFSTINVRLPSGEFPVAGSQRLTLGAAAPVAVAAPTFSLGGGATWSGIASEMCAGISGVRHVRLDFSAYERLTLGERTAQARVTSTDGTYSASGAPVEVIDGNEPDNDPTTARTLASNTLYVGHISASDDIDSGKLSITGMEPGTKVAAFVKVPQGSDFDLVLRKPAAPGVRSNPGGSIPGGSIPIEDPAAYVDNSDRALPPDTLADVPASTPGGSIPGGSIPGGSIPGGSIPGGSISANRGSATEAAQIVTAGESGDVIVDVSGYNGAHSTQPYVLRLQVTPPPPLPNCPAVTGLDDAAPGMLPAPSLLPAGTKTLFLVNRQRMVGLYGQLAVDNLLNSPLSPLNVAAARPEVQGAVLSVDGAQSVQSAYSAWDEAPCSIPAVNGVVRSIVNLVDTYRAALPNVKYIVVLGPDPVIPFWRQYDRVTISPEVDEASELAFTTNDLTEGNPLYASAAKNHFLTDGAYGARERLTWLGTDLPLPQDSVSRFVETPDDIAGQLQEYIDANGVLDPQSELTTGDDFFTDSAAAANQALVDGFPGIDENTLFPPTSAGWQRSHLIDEFFGKTVPGSSPAVSDVPDIGALYAHYNPWLAQPAGPVPITSLSQLVSTADVPAGNAIDWRLLYTIGCHSGLNIPDFYFGDAAKKNDWAGRYARGRAATYIANTGFGYDDTESIALSGRLMLLFSENVNRGNASIGEHWVDAVNTYYASAGNWDVLDEKVMLQATFYGPPWSSFQSPIAEQAETPPTTHMDGSLEVASLTVEPDATEQTTSDGRSYWSADGETLSTKYRSIQPLTTKNVTVPGKRARDAFITALTVNDFENRTPVRGNPAIERAEYEPEKNFPNIFWPATPVTVLRSPLGDRLNVIAGQFRPEPGQTDEGTERIVASISVDVAYPNAAQDDDVIRPSIKQVGAVMTGSSTAQAFVRATDESGSLDKVAVLFNDGVSNFRYQELTFEGGDLWTAELTGLAAPPEVIAQARDLGGNVGVGANKAVNHTAISDTESPDIVIDAPLAGGVFAPGAQIRARYRCSDEGAVTSCVGTNPVGALVDTSTVGPHTFTVEATDLAGNTETESVTYSVRYGFEGFFAPVDNQPRLNAVTAGRTIPLKWRLRNASGAQVTTLAAVTSVSSRQIRCPNATADPIETTVPAPLLPLKYDTGSQQYVYTWKTDPAWTGQCRRVFVGYADDTYKAADFSFR